MTGPQASTAVSALAYDVFTVKLSALFPLSSGLRFEILPVEESWDVEARPFCISFWAPFRVP